MRTTVAIDDDLLERAKAIARTRRVSLGRAVSDLLRHGLELQIVEEDGLPVFKVPPTAKPITSEDVHKTEDNW